MATVGDALGRLQQRVAKRLRWFTVYHAILAAISVVVIGWISLSSGYPELEWIFVYVAIVMPVGVPVIWWLNRRSFRRLMSSLEPFRPRISDARVTVGSGYLFVLDSGVVLALDPRSNTVRFIAFFSAGGAVLRPDMAQAARWSARIRGMRTEGAITNRKGPPEAQAELERLRTSFGAKWYMLFLREVRPERMAAGEPMGHEVLVFFIPRWSEHAKEVANGLDPVTSFLVTAKERYFQGGPSPA